MSSASVSKEQEEHERSGEKADYLSIARKLFHLCDVIDRYLVEHCYLSTELQELGVAQCLSILATRCLKKLNASDVP